MNLLDNIFAISTRTTKPVNSSCSYTLYLPRHPTNRLQRSIMMYKRVKIWNNITLAIESFTQRLNLQEETFLISY